MLNGYIVSYNITDRKGTTLINYYLFGRLSVSQSKKEKVYYYYPGLLENTEYYKLANGCYFTQEMIDDFNGALHIIPAQVDIKDDQLITSKKYWSKYVLINKINVKNF